MLNTSKNMINLPQEIISEYIMPFAYCPQPPELLRDIRSFTEDYKVVKNCSLMFFHRDSEDEDDEMIASMKEAFIISFFLNIINFCNDEKDIREIPTLRLGNILRRHVKNKDNYDMSIYDPVIMSYYLPVKKRKSFVKYMWGLLTPCERTTFINRYYVDKFDN